MAPCLSLIRKTLSRIDADMARKDFLEGLGKLKQEPPYTFVKRRVAVVKRKVVALVGVYSLKTTPRDALGICWFGVDPKYQHKEIGTLLVKWAVQETRKRRKRFLFVYSSDDAVPFYTKLGFGRSAKRIMPEESDVLLIKGVSV
jgi:predicted N-acetyltransferase YhbS